MRSRLVPNFALVAITVVGAIVWPAMSQSTFAAPCEAPSASIGVDEQPADQDSDRDAERDSDSAPDHEEHETERDGLDETERAIPAAVHASCAPQRRHGTSRLTSSARRRLATLRPTNGFEREEVRPPEA